MVLPSLRPLLTLPLQSREAVPTGGALGAAVGAAFSLAFQGAANIVPGAALGMALGAGWTGLQQCLERREARRHAPPQARALADYPSVRQLLRHAGTDVDDTVALKRLSDKLEADFGRMTGRFHTYCDLRGVLPNPLISGVIRHFYLTHCADRGVVLLSKRSVMACYLVAARMKQQGSIAAALNQEGVPAGTALRQLRCPYLRVDLANETLRDAHSFRVEEHHGEMRVLPVRAPMVRALEVSPLVEVTHRRSTRRRCPRHVLSGGGAEPTLSTCQGPLQVIRGPRLRAKLADLAPDSRTWRELNRIEEDLAAYRPCGHPVVYHGVAYQAVDLHWDGRRSPGRNAWRLLIQRTPEGQELVDVVDYHGPHW